MWELYSKSYIRRNRGSSVSVMVAAFAATLFLSLLCCMSYNFWVYETEKIILEEGDWQGRITGEISEEKLSIIRCFRNVDRAVVNEEGTVDVYVKHAGTIYRDMALIGEELGVEQGAISFHESLLSRYFVYDHENGKPPLLVALFFGILVLVCTSQILIIRGSFEVSMDARMRQFGIFSSVGATPKQIRVCLMQEAGVLCAVPAAFGCLIGVGAGYGIIKAVNVFAGDVPGRHEAVFQYHPFVLGVSLAASAVTVFVSARIPAGKLSKMTPLEALRSRDTLQTGRRKHSRILSALFGIEGEIAGNGLRAKRKSLRISSAALVLSFLGFSIMLVFTTLAEISTRHTYFQRYQDAWDVMVTVKESGREGFKLLEKVRMIDGVKAVAAYQKAEAVTWISRQQQSEELSGLGGLGTVAGRQEQEGRFEVKVPVIVLDDCSFLEYCRKIGAEPGLWGAVVFNRIWNSADSNFRYKEYVPFVQEDREPVELQSGDGTGRSVEIPVVSYTGTAPVLREEYEDYGLVQFMPLSFWKEICGDIGGAKQDGDVYIRVFSAGSGELDDLDKLEGEIMDALGKEYAAESENRVRERISNDYMVKGMVMIYGGFCVLLAVIGIADVFLNTLGFIRQRKREFARYMSVGMTPGQMRKVFCIEAFVVAGRPLGIALPLTAASAQVMAKVSYLEPGEFWAEAPVLPVAVFAAAIVGFVALAYYVGGRRLLGCDLNGVLRDDAAG